MAKFNPAIQIKGLKEIELIENLTYSRKYNSAYSFNFNFKKTVIGAGDLKRVFDFSKYLIKIEYSTKEEPKVFILDPAIKENAKHLFSDKSLCLYKKNKYKWQNSSSIATEIIPLIIMWVYYYELWLITNVWYGREASH